MFKHLQTINRRPAPFSVYTAAELWTDPHTARQMLNYHLNEELGLASRTPDVIDRTVAFLDERFDLAQGKRVADFGCGPGLYASRLARRGARVTGIDFSENSLAYARNLAAEHQLEIDYRQQNYLEFNSPERFDLICLIMCDFCALSPEQRRQLLGIFHRHLADDGALFLDVYSLAAYDRREEQASYAFNQLNGFWSAADYYAFVNTFKYEEEKVVLDKYSLFEAARSWVVYNWLQYYSLEELTEEFAANGFTLCEHYGDTTGRAYREDSDEIAVVVKKT